MVGASSPREGSAARAQAELVSVRVSTLDDPYERKPEWRIYVRSVAAWETLPDDGAQHWDPEE